MTKRLAATFWKVAASLFTLGFSARDTLPRFLLGRSYMYSKQDRPARLSPSLREREGTGGMTPETELILPPSSNHMDTLPPAQIITLMTVSSARRPDLPATSISSKNSPRTSSWPEYTSVANNRRCFVWPGLGQGKSSLE